MEHLKLSNMRIIHFLATKISFINQIASICEKIPDADIDDVSRTIGLDPRIGKLFLDAGPWVWWFLFAKGY